MWPPRPALTVSRLTTRRRRLQIRLLHDGRIFYSGQQQSLHDDALFGSRFISSATSHAALRHSFGDVARRQLLHDAVGRMRAPFHPRGILRFARTHLRRQTWPSCAEALSPGQTSHLAPLASLEPCAVSMLSLCR